MTNVVIDKKKLYINGKEVKVRFGDHLFSIRHIKTYSETVDSMKDYNRYKILYVVE